MYQERIEQASRINQAAIRVFDAISLNPYSDAFPPQRNECLTGNMRFATDFLEVGEEFSTVFRGRISQAGRNLRKGFTLIEYEDTYVFHHPIPEYGSVKLKIDAETQRRALWWNQRLLEQFDQGGVDAVANDRVQVGLELGTGRWLDLGNFMLEWRFVGNSLSFPTRPDIDLCRDFGVDFRTPAFFPHLKHFAFYRNPYREVLADSRPSGKAAVIALEKMCYLMKRNHVETCVIPGTWFLDPRLYEDPSDPLYSPEFAWIPFFTKKPIEIGLAKDVSPIQIDFALAISQKRQQAFRDGQFEPKIYATVVKLPELEETLKRVRADSFLG